MLDMHFFLTLIAHSQKGKSLLYHSTNIVKTLTVKPSASAHIKQIDGSCGGGGGGGGGIGGGDRNHIKTKR